jgi:hypothetical protein
MATKNSQTTTPATDTPVGNDPMAELEALMKRADEIRETAKASALDTIHQQIESLKRIGFFYNLVEQGQPRLNVPTNNGKGGAADFNPSRFCPLCQMQGHDKRAHRGQSPNPRPFTKEELSGMGLTPR